MSKDTQQQQKYKILLIGEICQDVYVFGSVKRLNPEAPVPILKKERKEFKQGMAGNVFKNINEMSDNVHIDFYCNSIQKIKKIRFIDEKSKYQIMRYDIEKELIPLSFDNIKEEKYDVIVISDYNKGFITDDLIKDLTKNFIGTQMFVDTKRSDISLFKNCIIKLNEKEASNIKKKRSSNKIITTLGHKGCKFLKKIYPVKKVDVHDVCGAGDTFLSALVVRWLETKDVTAAIKTANNCASLSVTKLGCYAVKRSEYENLRI
jgi:bifunctional ADP-heptose synthase (sugar kinase/adenylyltransferase)